MRKPPTCELPTVPEDAPARTGFITQTRQYRLITPLFGGGVEPGQADPVTVVRATEVRGHLRFWWRATRGGTYNGDLVSMKAAEDALWGAAAGNDGKGGPSQVEVVVTAWPPEKPKAFVADPKDRNTHISAPRSKYSYVAFPLNEKDSVTEPFKFTIELSFPDTIIFNGKQRDLRPEIEAALWAWETFGGIGARTRRGFGALQWLNPDDEACSPDATKKSVEDWLNKQLECHVVTGTWPDYVPHLPRACNADWIRVVTLDQKQSAQDVWVHLFTKLKNFRQLRFGRFGRSKWPEPEAIREITGQRLPKHQKMTPLIKKFPRAAFGLPIIFQFKDNDKRNSGRLNQDPKQTSLESILSDRFASPLILRPLILRGNQKAGIAIILAGTAVPLVDLKLKGAPSNQERVSGSLDPKTKEAKQIEALNGETDVLRAFLDSLR